MRQPRGARALHSASILLSAEDEDLVLVWDDSVHVLNVHPDEVDIDQQEWQDEITERNPGNKRHYFSALLFY